MKYLVTAIPNCRRSTVLFTMRKGAIAQMGRFATVQEPDMKVIVIAHLKGGTGKTTTTGFLAHALVNMGNKVLVIDADPQGSISRWSRRAHWSIPVRHLPSRHLDRDLAGILTDDFDFVVIDTAGPNSDAEIVASAMRAADLIVLPTAPNPADVERIKYTYDVAVGEGSADRVRILLTQVKSSGLDAKDAREAQAAAGRLVLDAEIRDRVAVARTTSLLPVKPALGYSGYTGVALELLK